MQKLHKIMRMKMFATLDKVKPYTKAIRRLNSALTRQMTVKVTDVIA